MKKRFEKWIYDIRFSVRDVSATPQVLPLKSRRMLIEPTKRELAKLWMAKVYEAAVQL